MLNSDNCQTLLSVIYHFRKYKDFYLFCHFALKIKVFFLSYSINLKINIDDIKLIYTHCNKKWRTKKGLSEWKENLYMRVQR